MLERATSAERKYDYERIYCISGDPSYYLSSNYRNIYYINDDPCNSSCSSLGLRAVWSHLASMGIVDVKMPGI